MKTIVVSQPMYFPWPGMLEQVRLSDVFVHYDDVQLPRGASFTTRVQYKTQSGPLWLSVPLRREGSLPAISEVHTDESQKWREKHLTSLKHAYARAPFRDDMLHLAETVLRMPTESLAELCIASLEALAAYFGLERPFFRSSVLDIGGKSTQRLLDITASQGGDRYVTGHGAKNYLEHELFENAGIKVEYMNYRRMPYEQLHGDFDPHVTALDLVACMGREGASLLCSGTIPWKEITA